MTASTAICNLLFASPSFLEELFWEELKIYWFWKIEDPLKKERDIVRDEV